MTSTSKIIRSHMNLRLLRRSYISPFNLKQNHLEETSTLTVLICTSLLYSTGLFSLGKIRFKGDLITVSGEGLWRWTLLFYKGVTGKGWGGMGAPGDNFSQWQHCESAALPSSRGFQDWAGQSVGPTGLDPALAKKGQARWAFRSSLHPETP